jgi:hypothetical protein
MNATSCSARNFTSSETSSTFETEVTNTPTISGTPLAPNSATDERESANTSDSERLGGELTVPVYRLNRSLTTFKQIWDEYTVGLGNGPAVKNLERDFNSKWRKGSTERKFFQRRSILYKGISDARTYGNLSIEEIIRALDTKMISEKKTLNWFVLNSNEITNLFLSD